MVVDSLKNPGCSTCSVRWVDDIGSVVVSKESSSVAFTVPSSSSVSSPVVVVGTKSAGATVTFGWMAVVVVVPTVVLAATVLEAVVLEGAVLEETVLEEAELEEVELEAATVLAEVAVVDDDDVGRGGGGGGNGCESYRFKEDSSLRRLQTPPSMSLVSMSARNTDMCRCSPYMRFIKPWFSKTNRRTACLKKTKYDSILISMSDNSCTRGENERVYIMCTPN